MKTPSYKTPALLLVLFHLISFSFLYFSKQFKVEILFVGGIMLLLFVLTYAIIILFKMGDKFMFLIISMLTFLGTLMLCRINIDLGYKQIILSAIGIAFFYIAFFLFKHIKIWEKLPEVYLCLAYSLFLITLFFGESIGGARNWLVIFGVSFQLSEIIKIIFILYLSSYFTYTANNPVQKPRDKYIFAFFSFLFMGFLVIQKEWGTALLLFSIYFFMLLIFDNKLVFLGLNGAIAIFGAYMGYRTFYHITVRVSTWLDPWSDISNKGYQITQSLFAIAAGGYFGLGLGNGSPNYIPEVHSDFIFAALCEEMGIFGGVAVILLFFLLTYRCFRISLFTQNPFYKSVTAGIALMFGFQTFIIIGGVIKLIPLTGITLPFVSYGGSSLISSFIALGIVQAISSIEQQNTACQNI